MTKTFGPYSTIRQAGNLYFVSGQVGVDPQTGRSPKDVKSQTSQALINIQTVLETNDLFMKDIVKTTVFLTNMNDFEAMNSIYVGFFDAPRPARSTVAVKELPRIVTNKLIVEIEAVVMKTSRA